MGPEPACYEASYDDAHLAANAAQSVTDIWLLKRGEDDFHLGVCQRGGDCAEAIGSSVEPGRQDQKLLTLWTKERGPISFMLTRKAIEILREVLTESPDQHSVSEPADRVLREANASFDHPPGG